MITVLWDAASLIQAYHKQSLIARWLNVSNRDKFASCMYSVNTCSKDLMISLQIQKTRGGGETDAGDKELVGLGVVYDLSGVRMEDDVMVYDLDA